MRYVSRFLFNHWHHWYIISSQNNKYSCNPSPLLKKNLPPSSKKNKNQQNRRKKTKKLPRTLYFWSSSKATCLIHSKGEAKQQRSILSLFVGQIWAQSVDKWIQSEPFFAKKSPRFVGCHPYTSPLSLSSGHVVWCITKKRRTIAELPASYFQPTRSWPKKVVI